MCNLVNVNIKPNLKNTLYSIEKRHKLKTLQIITDLVQGEFMQLGSKETENERFAHYLTKTYRKTASLIANSVKAVSKKLYNSIYMYIIE